MDEDLQAKLIALVKEHGPTVLLSARARKEQEAFRARLQAIMDGPVPTPAHHHGGLKA